MSKIKTMSYEFKDWKLAFKTFREKEEKFKDQIQLTISTDWTTSGYWIEPVGCPVKDGEKTYTGEEVYKLEKRVTKEIELAKKEHRGLSGVIW